MRKKDDGSFILKQRTKGEKVTYAILFVIFMLYAFALIFPFLWVLMKSLEDPVMYNVNIVLFGAFKFPDALHFENYVSAFTKMSYNNVNFLVMMLNSVWYVGIGVTWCTFWPIVTGYVFAKYDFKGKNVMYAIVIFSLTVPIAGTMGAYYKLVSFLKIYNTGPLFEIITGIGGFGSSFLIFYGIFKSISWSYAEAVFIDGGNNFTAFFRIMLPQAMPAITAIMVSSGISLWNEYYSVMMYMPSTPTVAAGLYFISLSIDRYGRPLYYAGLIISMIPILIVFSFSAGSMMKNLSIGGLKG